MKRFSTRAAFMFSASACAGLLFSTPIGYVKIDPQRLLSTDKCLWLGGSAFVTDQHYLRIYKREHGLR